MANYTGIPFVSTVVLSPPYARDRDGESITEVPMTVQSIKVTTVESAGIRYTLSVEGGETLDVALRGWDTATGTAGIPTGYGLRTARQLKEGGGFEAVGTIGIPLDPAPTDTMVGGGWGGALTSAAEGDESWPVVQVTGAVGWDSPLSVTPAYKMGYDWPLDDVVTQDPDAVTVTETGTYSRATLDLFVGALRHEYTLALSSYLWLPLTITEVSWKGRTL